MSFGNELLELFSLTEDLEDILRKRLGLGIEDFLLSDVAKRYFEYCFDILRSHISPKAQVFARRSSLDIDRFIIPHLILLLIGSIEDTNIRNTIIERELNRLFNIFSLFTPSASRDDTIRYLIDLANKIDLGVERCDKQLVIYEAIDKKGKLRVDIYDVKVNILSFLRILSRYKLSEKYDLTKYPISKGYIYLRVFDEDPEKPSLYALLKDIFRERMKELAKSYSVFRDHQIIKEFIAKLEELKTEYSKTKKNFEILRLLSRVRVIEKYSIEWSEELFPECIKKTLSKLRAGEDLSNDELYLLSSFLAYSNISIDEIRENIPEEQSFLIEIIRRIRDRFNEEIYYPPPPCAYIKKYMGIEDNECSSKDPLGEYIKRVKNFLKRSRKT
jgi:DNA primase large subunit